MITRKNSNQGKPVKGKINPQLILTKQFKLSNRSLFFPFRKSTRLVKSISAKAGLMQSQSCNTYINIFVKKFVILLAEEFKSTNKNPSFLH